MGRALRPPSMTTTPLELEKHVTTTDEQLLQASEATPWEARLARLRWWSAPVVLTVIIIAFWPALGKLSILLGLFVGVQAFRLISRFAHQRIRPLWLALHHRFGTGSMDEYIREEERFGREANAPGCSIIVVGAAQPGGKRVWIRLRAPQATPADGTIEVRRVKLARGEGPSTLERGCEVMDEALGIVVASLNPAMFGQLPPAVIDGFPCSVAHIDWQTAESRQGYCNLADPSAANHPMATFMSSALKAAEEVPVEFLSVAQWRHFE